MNIKNIKIVFENCESYTIPIQCIKLLEIIEGGYKTSIFKGDVYKERIINKVYLKLHNTNKIIPFYNFSKPFIERVEQYDDITYIEYTYDNNETEGINVPWNYKNDQYNSWQTTKVYNDNVIIKITKNNLKLLTKNY